MNPTTITIGECRLSYCNVFQPQAPANNPQPEPKFSVTILVPKSNTQAKAAMDAAVNAAIEAGVTAKWSGVRPPVPSICIHDGDGVRPSDGQAFGAECKGCWVFTASSKADRPPFVVDAQVQKIMREAYQRCEQILRDHAERLDKIAGFLMENENMSRTQFEAVMQDETLDQPKA